MPIFRPLIAVLLAAASLQLHAADDSLYIALGGSAGIRQRVDLRIGQLREPDPADGNTKVTAVAPRQHQIVRAGYNSLMKRSATLT